MQTGILDKTRLLSNILMLLLVAGNIFFSIQYTASIQADKEVRAETEQKDAQRLKMAKFLKMFTDTVLNTEKDVSQDERLALESMVRDTNDADVIRLWKEFVNSTDGASAQKVAVRLLSMLANKMI